MTFYEDEEQVWKCVQHSSKPRRCIGVCPICLKERLSSLCPDCANSLPCFCSSAATTSSAVSSSSAASTTSSFSLSSISTLIDSEPPFLRRSAFPFFRSARFSSALPPPEKSSSSFWSVFLGRKSRKEKMTRSNSVASVTGGVEFPATGKGWYLPSPMSVFRHSKSSKVAHQKSPLYRG